MVDWALELVRANAVLGYIVVALMCFAESFAFISLLAPGVVFMIAAGALAAQGVLSAIPLVVAGAAGATMGDAASYWIGLKFKHVVPKMWPFTRHAEWLERGHAFFRKYGGVSVFVGRFFGPVRAVIPLAAGMMEMPARSFWIANIGSAVLWAPGLVATGWGGNKLVTWAFDELQLSDPAVQIALGVAAVVAVAGLFAIRRWRAQRD